MLRCAAAARAALALPAAALPLRALATKTVAGPPHRKKVTALELQAMRDRSKPITMTTAYTYGSALHVDAAGIDVLLVGDSVAMVEHGHDTTLPVTMDEMLMHCRAVSRGANKPLLVGDMPFGSYEESQDVAIRNALRFLKEGGMDAIKMEGGGPATASIARALVERGVAVMGHVGLTPQQISKLGGFRVQGRSAFAALKLMEEAQRLETAGVFAIVIECVPPSVARAITSVLRVPTIGIGAGPHTSGQVLVYHDLLGMLEHAHHAKVAPRFCKQYANIGQQIQTALEDYRREVESSAFPEPVHCPYKMAAGQDAVLEDALETLLSIPDSDRAIKLTELLSTLNDKCMPAPASRVQVPATRKSTTEKDDEPPLAKLY